MVDISNLKKLSYKLFFLSLMAVLSVSIMGCQIPGLKGNNKDYGYDKQKIRDTPASRSFDDPNNKPDRVKLAQQLMAGGYYDVALVQLREAVKAGKDISFLYYLQGVCHRKEGELAEAERLLRKAIKTKNNLACAHNELGLTLWAQGRKQDAKKAFSRAIFHNPGQADFQNNLGFCYLNEGVLEQAEKHFRKSIALNGSFYLAYNNLAVCLLGTGKEKYAFDILCRVMAKARAYNDIGVEYENLGLPDKAFACYRRAIKLDSTLQVAANNLSRLETKFTENGDNTELSEQTAVPGIPSDRINPVAKILSAE